MIEEFWKIKVKGKLCVNENVNIVDIYYGAAIFKTWCDRYEPVTQVMETVWINWGTIRAFDGINLNNSYFSTK